MRNGQSDSEGQMPAAGGTLAPAPSKSAEVAQVRKIGIDTQLLRSPRKSRNFMTPTEQKPKPMRHAEHFPDGSALLVTGSGLVLVEARALYLVQRCG